MTTKRPNDINIDFHLEHLGDFGEIINKKLLFTKKKRENINVFLKIPEFFLEFRFAENGSVFR